jgi:hypothetical protein
MENITHTILSQNYFHFNQNYYKQEEGLAMDNKDTCTYAQHILNTGHTYGNIENTMEIIQIAKKGRHMNSTEKYPIYFMYKTNK